MGASLASLPGEGIADKQTQAYYVALESLSSLVLHTSRLLRARRPNRPGARSPHYKLDERAQNAQERDQVGTWIEANHFNSATIER